MSTNVSARVSKIITLLISCGLSSCPKEVTTVGMRMHPHPESFELPVVEVNFAYAPQKHCGEATFHTPHVCLVRAG